MKFDDSNTGGQIQCLSSNQIVSFRLTEVMKDIFNISEGDPLEFTIIPGATNVVSRDALFLSLLTVWFCRFDAKDLAQAIRIKLLSKESLLNGNGVERRLKGTVERDASGPNTSESKGNESNSTSNHRHQETSGLIRYSYDGVESKIPFALNNLSNTSSLFCGDQVEFSIAPGSKVASNISLVERQRLRGWIAIIREGKGFIESDGSFGSVEAIAFTTNSFTGEATQIDLGEEVEFSLRKSSGRSTAENILKVPVTIQNFYVSFSCRSLVRPVFSLRFFSQFCRRFIEVESSRLCEWFLLTIAKSSAEFRRSAMTACPANVIRTA